MIERLRIVETEAQDAAVIHIIVPRDQIQTVMGPAIHEVLGVLSDQGVQPAGPMFAHHIQPSRTTFDFEVGFPIDRPIQPVGRVRLSEIPAATVIRSVYHGPYEGLFGAWAEFGKRASAELGAELEERRLQSGETLWERYLVGPESSQTPDDWRTELNRPLVAAISAST